MHCIIIIIIVIIACLWLRELLACLLSLKSIDHLPPWERDQYIDNQSILFIVVLAVAPGPPKILVNGRSVEELLTAGSDSALPMAGLSTSSSADQYADQIGPFVEGSTVSMSCSSAGGRPLPEVRWYNGTHPLKSKMTLQHSEDEGPVVISTIRFVVSRYDLAGKFECRVTNNASSPQLSKSVVLDIHGEFHIHTNPLLWRGTALSS